MKHPASQDIIVTTHGRRQFLRLAAGIGTAGIAGGVLVACGGSDGGMESAAQLGTDFSACPVPEWSLYDSNRSSIGTVVVSNDAGKLYIKVTFSDTTARFAKLVFWAGTTWDPDGVTGACRPQLNENGGMWNYSSGAYESASHSYTIERSWTDVGVDAEALCDLDPAHQLPLHVVVYAQSTNGQAGFGGEQTGSSAGCNKQGNGPWWYYDDYTICCGVTPVAGSWSCKDSAFAYGTHILAAPRIHPQTGAVTNNPDKLPSLNLQGSNWGWAIQMTTPNDPAGTNYDLYSGAAQNDRDKGALIGSVHIVWTGTQATVTYTVTEGYALKKVDLYAGDSAPTTSAPGLFGNSITLAEGTRSYTFPSFELAETGTDGVWFVAHADVCEWITS